MPVVCSLLAVLILVAPIPAIAVPLLTADYTGLPVGFSPRLLASGDLTGDGLDDIVVDDAQGLGCLVARGDGTFAPLIRVDADATHASAIAIGDFDRDGIADLAITGQELPAVRIFHGLGDGRFGNQVDLAFLGGSPGLVAGDFDRDGITDLITSDPASRTIWAWFGRSDGSFRPPVTTFANIVAGRLLAGDLDGDGAPDLFVLHNNSQAGFTLMMNDGQGAFGPPVLYDGPGGSKLGSTGDFNGDGVPDIAIPESYRYPPDYFVAVWSGRRDGTFAGPTLVPTCGLATGTTAADLDADGDDDLVIAADRYQCLLRGSGTGLRLLDPTRPAYQMSAPIIVGRFDGDPALDVAAVERSDSGGGLSGSCTSYVGSTVFVWRGDGEGGFLGAPDLPLIGRPQALVAVDLDRDGHGDLLVGTSGSSGEVSFLRGRGDGTFETPVVRVHSGGIRALTVVDVDDDGKLELATIAGGVLVIDDVDEGFVLRARANRYVGSYAFEIGAGDFDRDGRVDFAITTTQPRAVWIHLAGGDFSYSETRELRLPHTPNAIAISDLDHDGSVDLLVGAGDASFPETPRLLHYRGTGDASFTLVDSMETGLAPRALAVLDRGPRLDPVVLAGAGSLWCNSDRSGALVLHSVEGVFAREQGPLPLGGRPLSLHLADLGGDGIPDMVAAASRGRITVRRGFPDGTYGDRLDFGVSKDVFDAVVADFDEDGRPDVAVASDAGIALLMNHGGVAYQSPEVAVRLGAGGSEAVLAYGDVRPLPFVIAGTQAVDAHAIDPASVRLSGARPILGRARIIDGVTPASPALDACATLLDGGDGRDDLEVVFRLDEVLDGWVQSLVPDSIASNSRVLELPFTARRADGTTIAGTACAIIVGSPHAEQLRSEISLRAFGLAPGFESGVGVVLTLPRVVERADVGVYDLAGRKRATLYSGSLAAGVHRLTWSGGGEGSGVRPGPGIYFARADLDGTRSTVRILVAR